MQGKMAATLQQFAGDVPPNQTSTFANTGSRRFAGTHRESRVRGGGVARSALTLNSSTFRKLFCSLAVYVKNLNEKVKIEELKKGLYHVFSQFGSIVDINAKRTLALKGQAWIVFDDLASAVKAVREMQGFNFYGKPVMVNFAKVKSDVISKADGTFVPRPKRKHETDKGTKKGDKSSGSSSGSSSTSSAEDGGDSETVKRARTAASNGESKEGKSSSSSAMEEDTQDNAPVPPSKILFLENLPPQFTPNMLNLFFQQYVLPSCVRDNLEQRC